MSSAPLSSQAIKSWAAEIGFQDCGIARARVLSKAADLAPGDRFSAVFRDGEVAALALGAPGRARPRRAPAPTAGQPEQPALF